jgi:hypothetical protein
MTANDKAQAGLRMIEEAIVQIIQEQGPMQPSAVSEALGIQWEAKDGKSNAIGLWIMQRMADTGKLAKGLGLRPTYSLPPSTHY